MKTKITVLIENNPSEANEKLISEHGLALLVEMEEGSFIFDTGKTDSLFENAKLLDADIAKAGFIVLSHAHHDHTGGVVRLVSEHGIKKLYTGKNFWRKKYKFLADENEYKYIGTPFSEEKLKALGVEQTEVDNLLKLNENAWLISNFRHFYDMEQALDYFVLEDKKTVDDFSDEISLVVREGDGVALITGCSHPGILNMTRTVYERLGLPVYTVFGGTHLMVANDERIDKTLTELKGLGVKRLILCHCSGEEVRERLKKDSSLQGEIVSTGDIVFI